MVDVTGWIAIAAFLFFIIIIIVYLASVTIQPYQQGIFTVWGSYKGLLNPGYNFITPIAGVIKVDLRTQVLEVPRARGHQGQLTHERRRSFTSRSSTYRRRTRCSPCRTTTSPPWRSPRRRSGRSSATWSSMRSSTTASGSTHGSGYPRPGHRPQSPMLRRSRSRRSTPSARPRPRWRNKPRPNASGGPRFCARTVKKRSAILVGRGSEALPEILQAEGVRQSKIL